MFKKNKTTSIPSGFGYKKPSVLKFGGSLTENKNARTSVLNEPTSAGEIITKQSLVGDGKTYPIIQNGESVITPETKTAPPESKITGALGSDLRQAQYVKKGWAFDDTIKGYDSDGTLAIKTESIKSVQAGKEIEIKGSTEGLNNLATPTPKTTKEVRKEGRKERKTIKSDNTLTKGERRGKLIDSRDKQKKTNKAKRKAGRAIKK